MRITRHLLVVFLVLAGVILLPANTRLGVFLVFDVAGGPTDNLDVDPENSPLVPCRTLSADASYFLPELMEQPGGIIIGTNTI